jgi:ribonuclease P protein component
MPAGPTACRRVLRLGRASRLKHSRDFARLKTEGRRLVSGCLILNWQGGSATASGRVGVVTSRRIGSAVIRSRARRLLREAWRRNQRGLGSAVDMVLVARPSIAGKRLADVERDFLLAVRRGGLMKTDAPA